MKIILASKSGVRKQILDKYQIDNEVIVSNVDEDEVKVSLLAEGASPLVISKNLAEIKSIKVSNKNPDRLVLGADSVISLKNELRKLYQLLKPGGILITGTPNISSIASKIFKGNFRLHGPGHFCLFNPKSLNDLLFSCNFKVFKREFPYWKTDYATAANFFRLFMPWKISPAFYGSVMTHYAHKI